MSADPPNWLPSFLGSAWQFFDQASPLANLLQIGGAVLASGSAVYFWFRRRLSHQGAIIEVLREDLNRREQALQQAAIRSEHLERRCGDLQARLAETALAAAHQEWQDGNDVLANRALQGWLECEG